MQDIDTLKQSPYKYSKLKFKLKNAKVFISPNDYYFIDYLDPVENLALEIDASALTEAKRRNIEQILESNKQKFLNQAELVKTYINLDKARILDIGCGGGKFLSLLKKEGADVAGIELCDSRAQYAKQIAKIDVYKCPIENPFWQENYNSFFDVVTLWDVIEHVNYPCKTLTCAYNVLKHGGLLMLDTPCRDGFYHSFGEVTYTLTRGKFPTFLNIMYSDHIFGHKQIFSIKNMKEMLEKIDFTIMELELVSELSFPYEYYIQRLFKSNYIVEFMSRFVNVFFSICNLKNKMIVVGKK